MQGLFPPSLLTMVDDVVPTLRAMAVRACADMSPDALAAALAAAPPEVARDVEAFVTLRRGARAADMVALLRGRRGRQASETSLVWPAPACWGVFASPWPALHALEVTGVPYALPLHAVAQAAPQLARVALRCVAGDTSYAALGQLPLTHLTLSGCRTAFNAPADGVDAAWLQQLRLLRHLDVSGCPLRDSMLAALRCWATLEVLDVSSTLCLDVVEVLGARAHALRELTLGTGERHDEEQLHIIPRSDARTVLPALHALTVVSRGLGAKADRVAECHELARWCEAHPTLRDARVYFVVDANSALPVEATTVPQRLGLLAPLPMRVTLASSWSADAIVDRLRVVATRELSPRLARTHSTLGPAPEWLLGCAAGLFETLHWWRHAPEDEMLRVASTALHLLVLFARLDHALAVEWEGRKHAFSHLVCQPGVAGFLFALMRDTARAVLAFREPPLCDDAGDDGDEADSDQESEDEAAGAQAALAHWRALRGVTASTVKLLCWAYDSTDLLVVRETQASLITALDAQLIVADAIRAAPSAKQASIVLFAQVGRTHALSTPPPSRSPRAQLAASQPYKARLLTPIAPTLLQLLRPDSGASPSEVEAALTCLGNLASHPPNTVALFAQHPHLLQLLVAMMEAFESPELAVVAHGAAYLSGNLSYIVTSVGAQLFSLSSYRAAIGRLAHHAFEVRFSGVGSRGRLRSLSQNHSLTGSFWSLWSACHAHDAAAELGLPPDATFDALLNRNVEGSCMCMCVCVFSHVRPSVLLTLRPLGHDPVLVDQSARSVAAHLQPAFALCARVWLVAAGQHQLPRTAPGQVCCCV